METNAISSSSLRRFSIAQAIILFLAVYSITMWCLMERVTDSGALLDSWRNEYAGGGSMSFRTPEGIAFVNLAIPYGLLVYPATVVAAFALMVGAWNSGAIWQRIYRFVLSAVMIAILIRFDFLGVVSCALGSL